MDVVTDLTAQAVSFITVLQDMCKSAAMPDRQIPGNNIYLWDVFTSAEKIQEKCTDRQKIRIKEIIWCSNPEATDDDITESFSLISYNVLSWLKNQIPYQIEEIKELLKTTKIENDTLSATPYLWRKCLRAMLYTSTLERIELAKKMHYMPIQIILCLDEETAGAYKQRIYQVYELDHASRLLLSDSDRDNNLDWWKGKHRFKFREEIVPELLEDDNLLLVELMACNNPVPFESMIHGELDEIRESRQKRKELAGELAWNKVHDEFFENSVDDLLEKDPLERAKKMNLVGLAFSGGGIRSATFNLGILQKLAEKDLLAHVDYLSTVSGGGYIGSWLAAWIKRDGSVSKVTDRLNTKESADPLAEEVRPIRWLRMYSNYLSPNASIMSADAWTVGITWLRNTLINQFVLLLLLCTGLSLVDVLFSIWQSFATQNHSYSDSHVFWWSLGILIPGSALASLGMHLFDSKPSQNIYSNFGKSWLFSWALIGWAILASFFISTWFFGSSGNLVFTDKVWALKMSAVVGFGGILLIAFLGNYTRYAERRLEKQLIYPAIIISSAFASVIGTFLLAAVWQLFDIICAQNLSGHYVGGNNDQVLRRLFDVSNIYQLLFIFGIPLILEVISFSVVIRMILMGRLFPDERREWWGRMGALSHRFSLIWLLLTICALVLPQVFRHPFWDWNKIPALFGGWVAIVGYAVRLAFSSTTSGDKPGKGGLSIKEVFVRFAPYLFMLGFLLIGAYSLVSFREFLIDKGLFKLMAGKTGEWMEHDISKSLVISLILLMVTWFLSWRVGVNEFSLHHFYRNRLVRAYLGATRRRTDRANTVNNFTGFDKEDDIKLAKFVVKDGYFGPFPLINTTLNATSASELDRQDRKAESFVFSPLFCGFDFSPTRSAAYTEDNVYKYGYRPTERYAYENGPKIGTAMAISGAAVNPNMGYHSSSATAFLLTMFNVRLGWWMGNPRLCYWQNSDPSTGIAYIVKDLVGKSDIDTNYVCLSDGGHFDNMGLYELVRRKCRYIILGDAEEDTNAVCEGLANAIRRCWIDFGVNIEIDTTPVTRKDDKTKYSKEHVVQGKIWYPGDDKNPGTLIYIKTSLTGDEPTDVREYDLQNPDFPQQSTGDQFFDESQFESYRKLGYHSIFEKR